MSRVPGIVARGLCSISRMTRVWSGAGALQKEGKPSILSPSGGGLSPSSGPRETFERLQYLIGRSWQEATVLKTQDLRDQLRKEIIGQDRAVDAVVRAVVVADLGICDPQ